MGEWLKKYIDQLKELWEKLNKRAKIIIGLSVLGIIVALGFLIFLGGSQDYKPLFGQLSPQDADAVVKTLEEKNINYKLADNGSTILVPAGVAQKTRLDMAGEGLPEKGVVGFEIFDQTNFGTTDFVRKVNFYRALGGEMSRTIQNMNIIEYARVQITAPRESLYIDKEKPSEASVLIKLKRGYDIEQSQIKAISNLVAGGVQDLKKENVTIVDTEGNLLTMDSSNGSIASSQMTSNQFEMEREFENKLKSDLRTMLFKVLGPGNFAVQVNASLNFDKRETESKSYSPVVDDQGIVRSEEIHEEESQGSTNNAEGTPGVTENVPQEDIPQYQADDGETQTSTYESRDSITNYEINEKIEKQVYAPGDVESLSVSVILNTGQDDETVAKIRNAVQAAIGYRAERDDRVSITSMQFDESLEKEVIAAQTSAAAAQTKQMYIYAGLIILVLIILITIFFVLRNPDQEEEYEPGQSVDMIVDQTVEEAQEEMAAAELSEEEKERRKMKEDIEDLVNDRPQEIAQLLKGWLQDE